MKTTAWHWLILLLVPGCLLVQPLDDAKPKQDGSAGSGNSSGKPSQGSAGLHSGGSTQTGGAGNKAGAGPVHPGGAPNGGASSGVDFSLFTGTWTITAGESITSCDGGPAKTETATPGGMDEFGLGTISDLVFGPGTQCEILADVYDRTASLNSATEDCSSSDATYDYYLSVAAFDFEVSGSGQTAHLTMSTSTLVSDIDGATYYCDSDYEFDYER